MAVLVNNMLGSFLGNGSGSGSGSGGSSTEVNGSLSIALNRSSTYNYGETFLTADAIVTYTPVDRRGRPLDPVIVWDPRNDIFEDVTFDPANGTALETSPEMYITATYGDISAKILINVTPNTEAPGTLTFEPESYYWEYGATYSTTGAVVKYKPTNGTEVTLWDPENETYYDVSNLTFDPADGTKLENPGNQIIKVSYKPPESNDTIVVGKKITVGEPKEDQYKGNLIINLPKTVYKYGEEFSTTGVTILFQSNDGSTSDVTLKTIGNLKLGSGSLSDGTELKTVGANQRVWATYETVKGNTVYGETYIEVMEQDKGTLTAAWANGEAVKNYIHGDQFNYTDVVVTYIDPETGTSTTLNSSDTKLTFNPSNGSNLNVDGPNRVVITYALGSDTVSDPDPVLLDYNVVATPKSAILYLSDYGAKANDPVSYRGAVLRVTYSDSNLNTKDIPYGTTGLTWSPIEGTALSAGTQKVTATYTENGVEVSADAEIYVGDLDLESITLSNLKTVYNAGDELIINDAVIIAHYKDSDFTKDVSSSVTWSKSGVVTESFTLLVWYRENNNTVSTSVQITVNPVEGDKNKPGQGHLTITLPDNKQVYKVNSTYGDIYNNAIVTCPMTDGTKKDVTAQVTWKTNRTLKITSAGDVDIEADLVIYDGSTMSGTLRVRVTNLEVTGIGLDLKKTEYEDGDIFTIEKCVNKVVVTYEDGSTHNLTLAEMRGCSWDPSLNSSLNHNNTHITVTYSENGKSVSVSRKISVPLALDSLEVTLYKSEYIVGEKITYSGSTAIATFTTGETKKVDISKLTWNPVSGKRLNKETTQSVVASYKYNGVTKYWNGSVSVRKKDSGSGGGSDSGGSGGGSGEGGTDPVTTKRLSSIEVTVPDSLIWDEGKAVTWNGSTITLNYSDNTSVTNNISSIDVDLTPPEGFILENSPSFPLYDMVLNDGGSSRIDASATYGEDGVSKTWTGKVKVKLKYPWGGAVPASISVTTPPTKLEYDDGETIDFSGIEVTAYDQLGTSLGIVPSNELEFPVTVARKPSDSGGGSDSGSSSGDIDHDYSGSQE